MKKIHRPHTAILALAALALAACQTDKLDGTTTGGTDGTTTGITLGIGQMDIAVSTTPDTRLALTPGSDAWEDGDRIRVTAPKPGGTNPGTTTPPTTTPATLTATYIYKVSGGTGSWTQIDPAESPQSTNPATGAPDTDTYPLYYDDIDHAASAAHITIQTWGGSTSWPATDPATTAEQRYRNQSDPAGTDPATPSALPANYRTGDNYRLQDHLLCPTAKLELGTATSGTPKTALLSGTLTHQRVDLVLRVLTDDAHPLTGSGYNNSPQMTFYGANTTGSTSEPRQIKAWYAGRVKAGSEGNTPGDTPGNTAGKAYALFRACLNLEDVPGIVPDNGSNGNGSVTPSGTVPTRSLLGYLEYTAATDLPADPANPTNPTGSTGSTGTGHLPIYYSVSGSTGGGATTTTLTAGKRLTVTADFTQVQFLTATATISAWNEEDGGHAGTGELPGGPVAAGDGTKTLAPNLFNLDHPTWIISGDNNGGAGADDDNVLDNVRTALDALPKDGTAQGKIDLILTNVTALPKRNGDNGVFYNYAQLRSVSLLVATSIGDYAFRNCRALTSISLPVATSIEDFAFYDCTALNTISLPVATSIGSNAFYGCTDLNTISLPKATSIGEQAFDGCYALTSISLP